MFFDVRAKFNLLKLTFHRVRLEYVDQDPNSTILTQSSNAPYFTLPIPHNAKYFRSFHYQGGTLWNNLPSSLRGIPDYTLLKSYVKRYLMSTYWVYLLFEIVTNVCFTMYLDTWTAPKWHLLVYVLFPPLYFLVYNLHCTYSSWADGRTWPRHKSVMWYICFLCVAFLNKNITL